MNTIEKVGVLIAAIAIVGGITYYTISGSSAFTLHDITPPVIEKVYVSNDGNDRWDGKTPETAVRSIARAVKIGAPFVVLVGPVYRLPWRAEHLQASDGIYLDHSIVLTSNQTPWMGAPSSAGGGSTAVYPDGRYEYLKFYRDAGESDASVMFASKFVTYEDLAFWTDNIASVRISTI